MYIYIYRYNYLYIMYIYIYISTWCFAGLTSPMFLFGPGSWVRFGSTPAWFAQRILGCAMTVDSTHGFYDYSKISQEIAHRLDSRSFSFDPTKSGSEADMDPRNHRLPTPSQAKEATEEKGIQIHRRWYPMMWTLVFKLLPSSLIYSLFLTLRGVILAPT